MSEENDRTTEEMETQPETDKKNEESKNETEMIVSQSDSAMLEDEEMPTYISVSTASRHDDSAVDNTKQSIRVPVEEEEEEGGEYHNRSPYPSDDQDAGSVCVLSSGEDSDHPPYNDEDEEDYGDSEDMDDMDIDNDHDNPILDEEDEEEEEEEEDEEDEDEDDDRPMRMHTDDEDIDGEFEPDCFDRASDDFILTNRLKPRHKRRGLSLQDLSVCKSSVSSYNGKRHSLNLGRPSYLGYSPAYQMHTVVQKKPMPHKYKHVESKVKRYIKDIKEQQSRRSAERRTKDQEQVPNKNSIEIKDANIEREKPNRIKDYLERAIKDIQDCSEASELYNPACLLENGEKNNTEKREERRKSAEKDIPMEIHCETTQSNNKGTINKQERFEKRNGAVEKNAQKRNTYQSTFESKISINVNANDLSLVNGYQQAPNMFDLRTLSYEEYMQSGNNSSQKSEIESKRNTYEIAENNESIAYNNPEIISVSDVESSNVTCSLKIENVQSIGTMSEESKDQPINLNFTKSSGLSDKQNVEKENSEIASLKTQLSQKCAQFNDLQDAYQKVLIDYMKMKQEMDELKKTVAMYEEENVPRETKTVAVQTDAVTIVESTAGAVNKGAEENKINNKVSANSVASTASSITRWTDSACSPGISMDPPDLKSILNSDDSTILSENTPRKNPRSLSQAFITSSRILQTLSSITQGKNKPESSLAFDPKKRKQNENFANDRTKENNSMLDSTLFTPSAGAKKRKATDMYEATSPFEQPFKIPHTSEEARRKSASATHAEAQGFDSKYQENLNARLKNMEHSEDPMSTTLITEEKDAGNVEEVTDLDDNVKCYVYREDENSKNRSFLIQAQESKNESAEKIRIRECGPYLLGNVEVRMSEVNGTINIWGKEISQDSESEEEANISKKSSESKSYQCWQRSPQIKFNGSQIICSTNKKPKVPPKFSTCNPKTTDNTKEHFERPTSPLIRVSNYETCESRESPRVRKEEIASKKGSYDSHEKLHSCCAHCVDLREREYQCACNRSKCKHDGIPFSPRGKAKVKGNSKFFPGSSANEHKHLHDAKHFPVDSNEPMCRHRLSCRRASWHNAVDDDRVENKCCNPVRDISHTCKAFNTSQECASTPRSCYHSQENEEDEMLLPSRGSAETPETRRRRSSGKKVRGILMDLLRGCGDCRNTSINSSKHYSQIDDAPYHSSRSPRNKPSPCTTPEPMCSSGHRSSERCSYEYARRIESQLEEVRLEMERVRSRSDAILDMLNMLHSVDTN